MATARVMIVITASESAVNVYGMAWLRFIFPTVC